MDKEVQEWAQGYLPAGIKCRKNERPQEPGRSAHAQDQAFRIDIQWGKWEYYPQFGIGKAEGAPSNGNPTKIKTRTADVRKPLAAKSEIVDAGNLVVIHKQGGVVKTVTQERQARILKILNEDKGPEVPVVRKGNTFLIEVDVMDQANAEGYQPAKKPIRGKDSMDVDYAGWAG